MGWRGAPRPAGPPPGDPWAGTGRFPALDQSPVGAWAEGAYGGFAVGWLIDSMILPQVHLRNGEGLLLVL